jgi:hypothetical protein
MVIWLKKLTSPEVCPPTTTANSQLAAGSKPADLKSLITGLFYQQSKAPCSKPMWFNLFLKIGFFA